MTRKDKEHSEDHHLSDREKALLAQNPLKIPFDQNPLIPEEPLRLRETDGTIHPPELVLRPMEEAALLEAETVNQDGNLRQRPHHTNTIFTDELKQRYIVLLSQYGIKYKCAKGVGVSPVTVRLHVRKDEEFSEACDIAMEIWRDSLEETVVDRAVHGWDEPVFSQKLGTQIGTIKKFDNRLLELLVKRHIPAFREKQQVDVNITGGVLVAPAASPSGQDWEKKHRGDVIDVEPEKLKQIDDDQTIEKT